MSPSFGAGGSVAGVLGSDDVGYDGEVGHVASERRLEGSQFDGSYCLERPAFRHFVDGIDCFTWVFVDRHA